MKQRILTDFHEWRDADLDLDAHHICQKMQGNPHFPTLEPEIAAVVAAAPKFRDAFIAAKDGGKAAHQAKDACRKALVQALRLLGFHINRLADGNVELLETTGYPLAKAVIARRKEKDGISLTVGHRSVAVSLKGDPDAGAYFLQYTAVPVTAESQWITVYLTRTDVVINGLETDVKYAFRVAPVFHLEEPEYSEPVISKYVE